MHAKPGDWLVIKSAVLDKPSRRGLITEVHGADGAPPYVVRWTHNDHEALVFPGPDAHIEASAPTDVGEDRPASVPRWTKRT
ncbi:DUF1918 domain-containing protein [Kutzneria kofuensis]|uniref:DUF1918 domain-containing protein n=1 Tax=Kutzneria kofuensis TaxID=103725 RepID=A0A7W9NLX0_9PSEU|nr:DUF1918 domain-containing protein [Kutzneria kofuensis]MBB5898057.1 hypothetical protein [Kutzneria kofuensis]